MASHTGAMSDLANMLHGRGNGPRLKQRPGRQVGLAPAAPLYRSSSMMFLRLTGVDESGIAQPSRMRHRRSHLVHRVGQEQRDLLSPSVGEGDHGCFNMLYFDTRRTMESQAQGDTQDDTGL